MRSTQPGDITLAIPWPTSQDYNEAVQFPEVSFEDSELQNGEVELTPIGLPKVASGNFAGVYRFSCGNKDCAVKCFLRNVFDQHRRYSMLSQFTMTTHVQHMVDFEYLLKGIRIEENWFPIVKMEWVEGLGLDQFIRKHWSNRAEINRVITQFTELMSDLQRMSIAHCDLQHGNILVKNDSIKLVDYDNMYVPAMFGELSAELGHANYQHLQRSEKDFGPQLDSFSAWIIYYSLFLLRLDSSLWQRFSGGDDCLLFRKSDFVNPDGSRLLADIKSHAVPDIQAQYEPILKLLKTPLQNVPKFSVSSGASKVNLTTSGGTSEDAVTKPPPVYPATWPTIEQFFWAAVKPRASYSDEKLARGVPVPTEGKTTTHVQVDATTQDKVSVGKLTIPGRNHAVFHVIGEMSEDGSRRHYAVKCFLNNVPDRHTRYSAIHRIKKTNSNKYFVPFVYQTQGIKVGNDWFPILKMLWVQGESLEDYVKKQLQFGYAVGIQELMPKFLKMIDALNADGIAHGDLEPRNIIVDEYGELKIIDYDAMYVPALANLQACETGLKSYQHPARNLTHYGSYIDNYSALALYGILNCLSRQPPHQYWNNWDTIMQQVRSQTAQLRVEGGRRPSSDRMNIPKQQWVGESGKNKRFSVDQKEAPFLGGMYPVFEKVTAHDTQVGNFDSALQKLSRVLKEQQKRRIDQVAKLDLNVWNLA